MLGHGVCASRESQGPFQGILGFSEGAELAIQFCAKSSFGCESQGKELNSIPGFAVLAGSPMPPCLTSLHATRPMTIPSIHMIGEMDRYKLRAR